MKQINVAILGLGTVGGGTLDILKNNQKEIARRAGREIKVVSACVKDVTKKRTCDVSQIKITDQPETIINDPNVDILIEVMGGIDPAYDLVKQAIKRGKHVVTANKALIALHGDDLFSFANKENVRIGFEASVAGGIPIIKAIREGLSANNIQWIAGIINGTGNFILTQMQSKASSFQEALEEAQSRGYAEADPTLDINGVDAAHKLTIMASSAYGIPLNFEAVYCEGIEKVATDDIEYAEQLGYRIKHLGIAKNTTEGIELRVHPALVPQRRLLANVDGVMNAVVVSSDAAGPTLFYGAGAGGMPTGSAIIADLVDIVKTLAAGAQDNADSIVMANTSKNAIKSMDAVKNPCYLKLRAKDQPGVLAQVTKILGDLDISIEAIIQKEPTNSETDVPIVILTHEVLEKNMNSALEKIQKLNTITDEIVRVRVENLG